MNKDKTSETFKACLFDLDGTLLDTAPEFTICLNQMLKKYQRPSITEAFLKSAVSKGAKNMLKHSFQIEDDDHKIDDLLTEFLTLYQNMLGAHTRFFPGIEKVLETFNQKNIPWGIVTNKTERFTKPLIKQFPLLTQAQCLVMGDTLEHAKPHAAPVLHALKHLPSSAKHTLYVGDAATDVIASKNAGVKSVVVSYGYIHPEEDLSTWDADYIIHHAEELLDYFS